MASGTVKAKRNTATAGGASAAREASRGESRGQVKRTLDFSGASSSTFYNSCGRNIANQAVEPAAAAEAVASIEVSRQTPENDNICFERFYSSIKTTLDTKFSEIFDKFDGITDKIEAIEVRQRALEEEVKSSTLTPSSTASSPTFSTPVGRRRRTPLALQSRIREVYNSFDDDNHFNLEEPVTSIHNTEVIEKIENALGTTDFTKELIRRGCKIYKKTLSEKGRHQSTPLKKKKTLRSLKQRAYERRSRAIRGEKERRRWSDLTPDMMSEEERVDDKFVRHPPSFRSTKVNEFISKLESRLAKKPSVGRLTRVQGSPRHAPHPIGAKKWTVTSPTEEQIVVEENQDSDVSDELFSD